MRLLGFGFILIILFSCQSNKVVNLSKRYYNLASDTMNYSVNEQNKIDSTSKSRLLIANSLLDSCIRYNSTYIRAYYWKSLYLFRLKNYLEAYTTASLGISKCAKGDEKTLVMLYVQRGILNLHLNKTDSFGDLVNALTLYDKAIKNKPDNLDAIMNKAIVLCCMNRKDEALEYLKSIKIKEKQPLIDDIIISINEFDMNDIFEK